MALAYPPVTMLGIVTDSVASSHPNPLLIGRFCFIFFASVDLIWKVLGAHILKMSFLNVGLPEKARSTSFLSSPSPEKMMEIEKTY